MEAIDFVITWVDGSDESWQAEKASYRASGDSRAIRYRDWDALRYWFRAVETYAPWVNRIHFVTWGHVPTWLNLEHPKLHLVRHKDFIPEEYLPTFSSHPIELNMHRIPGLAEQFVYFNDDFFLTAPVKPTDFFRHGLPCDSLEESPVELGSLSQMVRIKTNDIVLLNLHKSKKQSRRSFPAKWFPLNTPAVALKNLLLSPIRSRDFFGLKIHHLPQAYRKRTLEEVWAAEPGWLSETCSRKFRDDEDVSPHSFKFWQLVSGNFSPYPVRKAGAWFPAGTNCAAACDIIRRRSRKYLCYNDNDVPQQVFEQEKQALLEAFRFALPEKSAFER